MQKSCYSSMYNNNITYELLGMWCIYFQREKAVQFVCSCLLKLYEWLREAEK
jgi:hypothetical protein